MDPGDQVIITGGKWEGNAGTFVRPNGSNWVIEIDGEQRYIVPNNIEKIKGKSRIKVEVILLHNLLNKPKASRPEAV